MKKLYTAFALACAVSATAMAAAPASEKVAFTSFNAIQSVTDVTVLSKDMKKAPAKVAAAAEDIEGFYAVEYINPFSSPATKTTATIEMVDDTQIIITLEPYCNTYSNVTMDGIIADYDPGTGTITMKCDDNAKLGTADLESLGKVELGLRAQQLIPIPNDPEGKGEWQLIDEVTGVVQADGSIVLGDNDTMWGFGIVSQPGSWVGAFRGAKFVAPDYFKFVASEWEAAGSATFTDNWLNQLLKDEYKLDSWEVTLLRNKANKNLMCVQKPYDVQDWMNEDPEAAGYLVFDLQDPTLVPMRPLTESGLWMTMEEGGFAEGFYIFNLEGYQYYNNEINIADIKDLFKKNQLAPSNLDSSTGTLTLRNIQFSTTASPGGASSWIAGDNPTLTIKSQAFAGVEGIIADDEVVAPARYFNLQGMEVANPEAGQLVIKKEGSKTTKMIVR